MLVDLPAAEPRFLLSIRPRRGLLSPGLAKLANLGHTAPGSADWQPEEKRAISSPPPGNHDGD